ncbi:hypothetical protein D3C73_1157320 [compost metagenome]
MLVRNDNQALLYPLDKVEPHSTKARILPAKKSDAPMTSAALATAPLTRRYD